MADTALTKGKAAGKAEVAKVLKEVSSIRRYQKKSTGLSEDEIK